MYFHDLTTYEDWDASVVALERGLGQISDAVKKVLEIVEKYYPTMIETYKESLERL